jgi:L-fucono-1,5-lactonase
VGFPSVGREGWVAGGGRGQDGAVDGDIAVVDTHQHFWDLTAHDQPWLRQAGYPQLLRDFGPDDLRPLARAAGVGATVVVQTLIDPVETPELLEIAAADDLVAGVVGWVDLLDPAAAGALAALRARPDGAYLRGIRHPLLVEDDDEWLRRPAPLRGLAAVEAAGLCFDVVGRPSQLPAAAAAARERPGLTFVLDHLGNPDLDRGPRPDERWLRAITEFAALPNTVCKLSGILGEPAPGGRDPGSAAAEPGPGVAHLVPWYDAVLRAFGPGRLMFGSDWPVSTVSAPYHTVLAAARALTAGLSPAERRQLFAGTARRVYRLGPVPATGTS